MKTSVLRIFAVAFVAVLAIACGGGGGGGTAAAPGGGSSGGSPGGGTGGGGAGGGSGGGGGSSGPTPGEDETGGINGGGRWVSQGSVSRLGSIVVNGVRFDAGAAAITVNGAPGSEADLRPGLVLRVLGEVAVGGAAGVAERVVYENSLRGAVQQVDATTNSMRLLGQDVRVTLATIYGDGLSSDGLLAIGVGDGLVISGFLDSAGRLQASRVDRDPAPGTAEIVGTVTGLDATGRRFNINGLVVDYAAASLDGFPGGGPADGETVRVRGPAPSGTGALVAAAVSWRAAGVVAAADDNVNVEGIVTRFGSAADFDVAGQRVLTTASTRYVATTAASLQADDFLDVQGERDGEGRLVAARIERLPPADTLIEARLDGVDAAAGTLQLLGITVHTTARTRFHDDDDERLSLADLRAGDAVEIAGYLSEGRFIAVRVELDDDGDDGVEIDGPVADLADPEFRIGGIRIVTDALTEFDDTSRAEFFSSGAGRRAEVEGRWTGTFVLAEEVELE